MDGSGPPPALMRESGPVIPPPSRSLKKSPDIFYLGFLLSLIYNQYPTHACTCLMPNMIHVCIYTNTRPLNIDMKIERYTGTHDTLCPITLTPAHELEHPVAFKNALAFPFELDALVQWMTISDIHPTTRLLMPNIYDIKALLLHSESAALETSKRIQSYYNDSLARYLTRASPVRVIASISNMTMEQMESMLLVYVARVEERGKIIMALVKYNQELRLENQKLRLENQKLRLENQKLREALQGSTWWAYASLITATTLCAYIIY